jgi:predicted permease
MRRRGIRGLFRPDPRHVVEEELRYHVEMREREMIARGETPERARRLALERFGDWDAARSECVAIAERRERLTIGDFMGELRQDFGWALRMLRRKPAFAVVAVLTLGLGIGATSTIFSVVNATVLAALPYRDADRLYAVHTRYPDGTDYSFSAPDFMSVSENNRVFEEVGAMTGGSLTLLGRDQPMEVAGAQVSRGLFEMLGMSMHTGRTFRPEEHEPGRHRVVILSHAFWQREFGGQSTVLEQTLRLAGEPYSVVGVLKLDAVLPGDWDVYAPLPFDSTFDAATAIARRSEYLDVVGRARPGQSAEQIHADLGALGTRLQAEFPATNAQQTFSATPLHDVLVGETRTPLLILLGAVGFVLLVACVNVANLLLARGSARHGEIAVRTALGAGRGRLVRQLMTEALVLGLLGGAVGLFIAWAGTIALVRARPVDIPRLDQVAIDPAAIAFTFALALITGLLFGVLPALQTTRGPARVLRGSGWGTTGSGTRIRSMLIVAEVGLAVALLVGAGLLIRSFVERMRVDPGFQVENALTFRVTLQGATYESAQPIRDFADRLFEQIREVPGVVNVGGTTTLPARGLGGLINFAVGNEPPPAGVNAEIGIASVTPTYFDALGTRVVSGRAFTDFDRSDAPPVAIVNEAAVRRWFGGEDPVGRRATIGIEREIVGVVSDVVQRTPGTPPAPQAFTPYFQRTSRTIRVLVRTSGDPLQVVAAVRSVVRRLDPDLPVNDVAPLTGVLDEALARPRFYTSLLSLFAGVALALAAIGVFGVMSYSVAQRTREISVRMALGASRSGVVRMIVGHAMMLAGIGLALGLGAALALGRVLQSQLYEVGVGDPFTFAIVAFTLAACAALASFLPARRAASLDPARALREG